MMASNLMALLEKSSLALSVEISRDGAYLKEGHQGKF